MKSLIILAIVFCPVFAFPGALRKKSKKPARISQNLVTPSKPPPPLPSISDPNGQLPSVSDPSPPGYNANGQQDNLLRERQKALMEDNKDFMKRKYEAKQAQASNIDPVTRTGGGRGMIKVGSGGPTGGGRGMIKGGPDGCRYKWIYPPRTPNNPVKVCTWPSSSAYYETRPSGGGAGFGGVICKPVSGTSLEMKCSRTSSSSNYYKEINPKTGKRFPFKTGGGERFLPAKGLQWDPNVKTGGGAVR